MRHRTPCHGNFLKRSGRARPGPSIIFELLSVGDGRGPKCDQLMSRVAGFRASPPPARSAEQAAAVPTPRNRPQRIACQLIVKENLEHGEVRRPSPIDGAALTKKTACRIASAMQFLRGFRDHAALVARARAVVFGWFSAAVAP